jgi:hypothetical protein
MGPYSAPAFGGAAAFLLILGATIGLIVGATIVHLISASA